MVGPPQFLKHRFIIKNASSVSSIVYGFGLFQAQSPPFDQHCLYVFWFTTYKFMALVVRIEPNGSQNFLSHDEAMDSLA